MRDDDSKSPDVQNDEAPADLPPRQPDPNDDATVKGGVRAGGGSATPPGEPIPYPN